jgi:hypothetical protein
MLLGWIVPAALDLWREMWKEGYRHIAGELSPWAAHQLELVPAGKALKFWGFGQSERLRTCTRSQLRMTVSFGVVISKRSSRNGWSAELARLNLHDSRLQRMAELTNNGYSREKAPEQLELLNREPCTDR